MTKSDHIGIRFGLWVHFVYIYIRLEFALRSLIFILIYQKSAKLFGCKYQIVFVSAYEKKGST